MTNPHGTPSTLLGTELTDALDRTLQTSLDSLASLRSAVRAYTIHQRDRGLSLPTLMVQALKVLTEAEDARGDLTNIAPVRDGELARQLDTWCREDFAERS